MKCVGTMSLLDMDQLAHCGMKKVGTENKPGGSSVSSQ